MFNVESLNHETSITGTIIGTYRHMCHELRYVLSLRVIAWQNRQLHGHLAAVHQNAQASQAASHADGRGGRLPHDKLFLCA